MTSTPPGAAPAPGPPPVPRGTVVSDGVRHLLLAVQFFTRLPLGDRLAGWVGFSPAMLRAGAAHLPAIGWLVGLPAVLAMAAGTTLWTPTVAAVLAIGVTVWSTGAFHEDGLADTADGLGGAVPRQRALEIMRDSRIGTYGAVALVLALTLRTAALAGLIARGLPDAAAALLVAAVLSRCGPVLLMRVMAYVGGPDGKAALTADGVSRRGLAVAVGWATPAVVLAVLQFGSQSALLVLGGGLPLWLMYRLLSRRLGGYTGDALGATQQVVELGILLALLS